MFERDLAQSDEGIESTSESKESRELDQATHEPVSKLEGTSSVEQAEMIESSVRGLVDSSQPTEKLAGDHQEAGDISEGLIEKELPEGGQQYEEPSPQKDLDAGFDDSDLGSLIPGKGKLTDPLGGDKEDTDFVGQLGVDVGFDEDPGIDDSPENPTGEEHPGLGPFLPGKGPDGGVIEEGADVHISATVYTPQQVRQLELEAMKLSRGHDNIQKFNAVKAELNKIYDSGGDGNKGAIVPDDPPPPKPKTKTKTDTKSTTPEGSRDMKVKPPTQEEINRVIEETSGDEISNIDPDNTDGVQPDGILPKYAEHVKNTMERAQESKGAKRKAGSEVVTDPPAPVGGSGEGGPKPGDQKVGKKKSGQ